MRDTWSDRDGLVLNALVEAFDDPDKQPAMTVETLVDATGLVERDVRAALIALQREDPPLIDGLRVIGERHPIQIMDVTAEAYRRVGAWPTPERLVDRLVAGLQRAADDEPDEIRRSRMRQIALDLAGAFRGVATEVAAAAVIKSVGPG